MSTLVPPLFAGLVDDASMIPPDAVGVPDALAAHRRHRDSWYAPFVGPLQVPTSAVAALDPAALPADGIGVVADTGVDAVVDAARRALAAGLPVRQVEAAVAKRGEDPQPGLGRLRALAGAEPTIEVYAEIPLTWGLLAALDTVAGWRAEGLRLAPKFRVAGLAAELFPTPVELAAVICACRDRDLPFKVTAGLSQALRHTDPETGFSHHGFLNVLVADLQAADGAEVADVAETLAAVHPVPLVEPARANRDAARPLWRGFGTADPVRPLTELIRYGLVNGGFE